ncbi:MAG: hypothetical protein RIR26_733 [Pseudomonadota bacterium]
MKIFFCSEMVAHSNCFSPSATKPQHFVEGIKKIDIPVELIRPVPVSVEQLELAHESSYVRGVLDCSIANGFGNRSQEVADSLPWTSGAMLSAAESALSNGITCAPVSGFHHAGYRHGGGFCTFNGLMVTAQVLRMNHVGIRVAIVDADQHYGDGTDDILSHLGIKDIFHFTFGRHFRTRHDSAEYLKTARAIPEMVKKFGADIVLYQAGADVHVDDPLGGVLTSEQIAERDESIVAGCWREGIPVAWNLAGGYQRDADNGISKVINIHLETAKVAHAALARR